MSPRQLIISLFVFSFTSISVAQTQWTEVITDNEPLPGVAGNYNLYGASLATGGDIVFVTGVPTMEDESFHTDDYWLLHNGTIQSIARLDGTNTDAPVYGFTFNNTGDYAMASYDYGFQAGPVGQPTNVIGPALPPVEPPDTLSSFSLNDAGELAVTGTNGIWAGNPHQTLSLIAGTGPAPGTTYNFSGIADVTQFGTPLINSSGLVVFMWALMDSQGDYQGPSIWIGHNSTDLQLVYKGGQSYLENSQLWSGPPQALSNDGKVLLPVDLSNPSAKTHQNAEFIYQNSSLSQLSPTGSPAPGAPGATFSQVAWSVMDHTGHLATRAMITGTGITSTNDIGIWIGNPGSQQLALQTGSPAPGTPDVFSDLLPYHTNALGQILFVGVLTGPDVGQYNEFGYWLWSPDGQDQLILRAGEPIDLGNGLTAPAIMQDSQEVIASESWTNFDDPAIFVPDLDDQGQILWSFNANGTPGVFETLPIPEPFAVTLFPLAILLLRRPPR